MSWMCLETWILQSAQVHTNATYQIVKLETKIIYVKTVLNKY